MVKIIEKNHKWYNKTTNNRLMSPSRFMKCFREKDLSFVDPQELEKIIDYGKQISKDLEDFFYGSGKIKNNYNAKIIKKLLGGEYNLDTLIIESHRFDEIWHGFIDIETHDKIIEIKTRNHTTCELDTVFQSEVYKKITGKDYEIWHINRITGEITVIKPTKKMIERSLKMIAGAEEIVKAIWTKLQHD